MAPITQGTGRRQGPIDTVTHYEDGIYRPQEGHTDQRARTESHPRFCTYTET